MCCKMLRTYLFSQKNLNFRALLAAIRPTALAHSCSYKYFS